MPDQLLNSLNAALSAAVSGAALALTQVVLDPNNINWKRTGSVALGGAVIGLVNHYRTPPTVQAQSAMALQQSPSGQVAAASNAVIGAVASQVKADADEVKKQSE